MSEDKARFLALAERFCQSADDVERQRIKEELIRMTFGAQVEEEKPHVRPC